MFVPLIMYDELMTSQVNPATTTQTTNNHHHHGDGATCPSSGVDSMNPHRLSGGPPCAYIARGRWQRILFNSIN